MAGISSKSAGSLINRKGYNGNELQNNEFSDGSGLEFYDFNARTYDQQIGRFLQIDPKSELENQESWSPYHFTFDNPINNSDPDGTNPIYPLYRAYRLLKTLYDLLPGGKGIQKDMPIAIKDNLNVASKILIIPVLKTTPESSDAKADDSKSTTTTNTKKDRVVDQKPGEKAQNQKEGIEKAHDKAKKDAPPGEKQNKINSDKKSEQNLKKELKNIKSLKDAKENF